MNTNVTSRKPSLSDADDLYEFSPDLVTLIDGRQQEAEAIRTMRTHIRAQHLECGRRGLAFCAPNPQSGCTYSAANLAVSLSQIGVNTLLIDADMRSPGVDGFIRSKANGPGLRELLGGSGDLEDVTHKGVLPNLSVIFAGGVSADAQELLGGESFKSLIVRCLRDYECTIVDTPAANLCADARRISSVIGYSAVVARRDVSFIGEVSALVRQIEADGARVVGTILNEP